MNELLNKVLEYLTLYGIRVIAALAILVIGRWIALWIRSLLAKLLKKRNVDGTIISFLSSIVYIGLLVFVVISALKQLGIDTTSAAAVIAAAGLAIGLALQGSLANFAAGFLLIIFHPFKEGDFIEAAGSAGIVKKIQIFTTTLLTPDNKMIIIPNNKITGDNITNFTAQETRRIEWIVGVSYEDDIDKVKKILSGIIEKDERILSDPAPQVAVKELADSSVNFVVRAWAKTSDYWNVFFDTTESVKKRLDEEGVSIPFPQQDVHLFEHQKA